MFGSSSFVLRGIAKASTTPARVACTPDFNTHIQRITPTTTYAAILLTPRTYKHMEVVQSQPTRKPQSKGFTRQRKASQLLRKQSQERRNTTHRSTMSHPPPSLGAQQPRQAVPPPAKKLRATLDLEAPGPAHYEDIWTSCSTSEEHLKTQARSLAPNDLGSSDHRT